MSEIIRTRERPTDIYDILRKTDLKVWYLTFLLKILRNISSKEHLFINEIKNSKSAKEISVGLEGELLV